MTSWAVNATVSFQHVEEKEARRRTFRRGENLVKPNDDSMPQQIPGVNTSINFERRVYLQFSHGFNLWRQDRLSFPELTIMRLINDFTDWEDWQIKIDDFSACRAWREEKFAIKFLESNNLWDWCVFELRKKAFEFASSRSVFVFDSASRICKSDRLVGSDLFEKLKLDTRLLSLSPWMLPFVFDVSPIRIDGRPITLNNFLDSMTIGQPCRSNWDPDRLNNGDPLYYSGKSQWIATDVRFSSKDGRASIISPINNLHPVKHKAIYTAVERLIFDVIDDWNQTLLYKDLARGVSRIKPMLSRCAACAACAAGSRNVCSCPVVFREYSAWVDGRHSNASSDNWRDQRWNPVMALDGKYPNSKKIYDKVSLRDGFKDRGLQIYVDISTIELGSNGSVSEDSMHHMHWNLNGNRNERIVASTLICLRRENIDPVSGGISFRTETKRGAWEDIPDEHRQLNRQMLAGLSTPSGRPAVADGPQPGDRKRTPAFQELGTIRLPEGRIVTYPNTLQHKFEASKLEEPSRSGFIQFMQVHLVDPHYVVCSTRSVPPQSLDWWKEAIDYESICLKKRLPHELSREIIEYLLVPERWLNRKRKRVRGLQNYWQTFTPSLNSCGDVNQPRQPCEACQPPIRYESALRRKQDALQRHERVLRAVNGPKAHGQPRAFTVWMQSRLRDSKPGSDSDSEDLLTILAPEADGSVASKTGHDAVNGFQDTEDDSIEDFDAPLMVDVSSGSEGSTDGEHKPVREGDSDGGDGDVDEGNTDYGGDGTNQEDGDEDDGGSWGSDGAQGGEDEDVVEESDKEGNYVDAMYGFTPPENEETEVEDQLECTRAPSPRGDTVPPGRRRVVDAELRFDDAMSQADEMEPAEIR